MAIDLQAAIAVFDKSADRTKPNAQTEAWAVIRAELMRVMGAPVGRVKEVGGSLVMIGDLAEPYRATAKPVRLVPADGGE